MRPESKVWRKAQRQKLRRVKTGRRHTHPRRVNPRVPESTWARRHPVEWRQYLDDLTSAST